MSPECGTIMCNGPDDCLWVKTIRDHLVGQVSREHKKLWLALLKTKKLSLCANKAEFEKAMGELENGMPAQQVDKTGF